MKYKHIPDDITEFVTSLYILYGEQIDSRNISPEMDSRWRKLYEKYSETWSDVMYNPCIVISNSWGDRSGHHSISPEFINWLTNRQK
jgi:hypothetical protein